MDKRSYFATKLAVLCLDLRLDELQTCSRCKYKLSMCSCASNQRDYGYTSKFSEEAQNLKIYSEKFKNKKLVLVPEESKKKVVNSDSEEEEAPKRSGSRPIGMEGSTNTISSHYDHGTISSNNLISIYTVQLFLHSYELIVGKYRTAC
mgnify:CR=1 FL=1